jgi:hypothetical protein
MLLLLGPIFAKHFLPPTFIDGAHVPVVCAGCVFWAVEAR